MYKRQVLVSLQFPDGAAKLRIFKGKRPRELSLQGQTTPGVLTLDDQAWREPFVVRRGSREWALIEREHDLPGAQLAGTHAYVAVDLSRASAGPEIVAQRSSIARSGRAIQGQPGGRVVDLITGETSPRPDGSTWSVADSFWYQVQGSTLRYGDLEGGETKTLPLPPGATVTASEAAPLEDFLIFRAGGSQAPTVGTVDLRRGRVEVLQTIDEAHDLQVSAYVVTSKAAFFLLRFRAGASGPESLRIIRRSR